MTADLHERFVALTHELWCAHMSAEGWSPGDQYDPQARIHDAIRPFAALDAQDRADTECRLRSNGMPERLIGLIEYTRGPDRPFRLTEIHAGLPVRLTPDVAGGQDSGEVGKIHSWDDDGELVTRIRVMWPDGQTTDHVPVERDLERVGW